MSISWRSLQTQARTSRGLQVARKPPFRQKKKKKKKKKKRSLRFDRGQPSGHYLRSLAPKALHASVRSSQSLAWGVELGRGTAVPPPCPHKRFRRVSWQTGQFTATLVSLRSWEAELLSVRQDVQETANSPTVHLWVVCSSSKAAHNLRACEKMTSQTWWLSLTMIRSFVRHHVMSDEGSSSTTTTTFGWSCTEVGWLSQMLENAFLLL